VGLILLIVSATLLSPSEPGTATHEPSVTAESLPPRTGVWSVNITLYGNAGAGWGFGSANMTIPGPNITVYRGDVVNLTLIATDASVPHNWFIDYDGNLQPSAGEPSSPDFNSGAAVRNWSFVADRNGNWTYRCRYHATSMHGTITVLIQPRPVRFVLYGNAASGWGFSSTKITNPGPPLVFLWGTRVNLTLRATDTLVTHSWFLDYNDNLQADANEPKSPDFSSATAVNNWSFVADRTGNWTYRCSYHQNSMTGIVTIIGGPPPNLPVARTVPLITAIMLGALGVVFVFAAVYHYRAVRLAKRKR
jgi:plastocyanin